MRISDWSSDVCSSGLFAAAHRHQCVAQLVAGAELVGPGIEERGEAAHAVGLEDRDEGEHRQPDHHRQRHPRQVDAAERSEEHTSELQSLMRTSYAVFCLKQKKS